MTRAQLPPLLVGTLAVLAVAAYLGVESPGPGPLAAVHASIEDGEKLQGCVRCHTAEGLVAGCLDCHGDIAAELRKDAGYHAFLLRGKPPACKGCHPDHLGAAFAITPELKEFDHPHVKFALVEGAHERLACEKCHTRKGTYLGLTQACVSCHENIHKEERFLGCAGCHDQTTFSQPRNFKHDKLPLVNGHKGVSCAKCHEDKENYASVRGHACVECHPSPHRADLGQDCEKCHARDASPWAAGAKQIDAAFHARVTGFPLVRPHDVECAKCHQGPTFAARYPSPPRPPTSCTACHEDVHKGQFADKKCLDCHEKDHWKPAKIDHSFFPLRFAHGNLECAKCHESGGFKGTPKECAGCHEDKHRGQFGKTSCDACHDEASFKPSLFTVKRHVTFPLDGAHAKVECSKCHADGRFRGAPRACAGCHEDPHRAQFGKTSCDACHTTRAFRPSAFGLERHTSFALSGAHGAVACDACHAGGRFRGAPRACAGCHEDPHGAQFGKGECSTCHAADASTFRIRPFDHAKRANYPLEGAHADAACARCHVEKKGVRVYRGVARECTACHTDVHRGQFKDTSCDRCHTSREEWKAKGFDHGKSKFPLDKAHAPVACDRCHFAVRQPDGGMAVQYRPLSTECQSCHAVK
ncbi:MAG TPA: cytochrome c3 family protein [Planctomycetota bacterium]|nr:cytochrome c3 family protein [Planctomycetota bacterium]